MTLVRRGALCAVLFFLLSVGAQAQTSVPVDGIYALLQPYVLAVVSVLATAIVGWLAELLRRKFNLDIEAAHRDALQTALTNGAGLIAGKIGGALAGRTIDLKSVLLAEAVNYVLQAVPDAVRHFGVTPELLAEKILAKLPQMAKADA